MAYDARGNQLGDGADAYSWDPADRLVGVAAPTSTVAYTRDGLDRLVERADAATTTRYSYSGHSDAPAAILDAAGNVTQGLLALPGGVLVTISGTTRTWSFPDLAGHHTAITDSSGARSAPVVAYDPWGAELSAGTVIDNTAGEADLGAYGGAAKLTERATARPIVLMGARALSTTRGRFLSVDPIEGGCANAYVYLFGDPLNAQDLSGKGWLGDAWDGLRCAVAKNPLTAIGLGLALVALFVSPAGVASLWIYRAGVSVGTINTAVTCAGGIGVDCGLAVGGVGLTVGARKLGKAAGGRVNSALVASGIASGTGTAA